MTQLDFKLHSRTVNAIASYLIARTIIASAHACISVHVLEQYRKDAYAAESLSNRAEQACRRDAQGQGNLKSSSSFSLLMGTHIQKPMTLQSSSTCKGLSTSKRSPFPESSSSSKLYSLSRLLSLICCKDAESQLKSLRLH